MGRGGPVYLSYSALVLLSAAASGVAFEYQGLWHVGIDESPAPLPQDGPPFSAHASRNPQLLPYQIVGVVASYFGAVLIIGTLLLTLGRSLRRRAQLVHSKPTEMTKPMAKFFDPSPVSPVSAGDWYGSRREPSKRSLNGSMMSGMSKSTSPEVRSMASFDQNVIQQDKQKRADEMARLYAAVMAQEDADNSLRDTLTTPAEAQSPSPPDYQGGFTQRFHPAEQTGHTLPYQTVRDQDGSQWNARTPRSPIYAIYPPPVPPKNQQYLGSHWAIPENSNAPHSSAYLGQTQEASPDLSQEGGDTSSYTPRKLRKSLRSLKISSPIRTVREESGDDGYTPLSPRTYEDPGTPPEPPTARTLDSYYAPPTPGTAVSYPFPEPYPMSEDYSQPARDMPSPSPQRTKPTLPSAVLQRDPNAARQGLTPINIAASNRPVNQSAARIGASLPLRQQPNHPTSPGSAYTSFAKPLSAGPIKTTFLEARRDKFVAPRTGLGTPYRGHVPYTPFTPMTPATPVTPHLTSRAERKQRERDERAIRGPIAEEDAVADERDIWDSAY